MTPQPVRLRAVEDDGEAGGKERGPDHREVDVGREVLRAGCLQRVAARLARDVGAHGVTAAVTWAVRPVVDQHNQPGGQRPDEFGDEARQARPDDEAAAVGQRKLRLAVVTAEPAPAVEPHPDLAPALDEPERQCVEHFVRDDRARERLELRSGGDEPRRGVVVCLPRAHPEGRLDQDLRPDRGRQRPVPRAGLDDRPGARDLGRDGGREGGMQRRRGGERAAHADPRTTGVEAVCRVVEAGVDPGVEAQRAVAPDPLAQARR